MVKHIVLWKLKDNAEGSPRARNLERAQALLEALPGVIREIKEFEVGQVLEPSVSGFDLALFSSFASREALQKYLDHPEHQKAAKFIRAVTAQRAAVDYEI
jgi:hypothetical protein